MKKMIIAVLWIAVQLQGQTRAAPQYRVHIRMRESNAQSKPKEGTYTLLLQAEQKGTLNASYRIPYFGSSKGDAKELHTVALGSIFDCVAREADGGVKLDCGFESSSVANHQQTATPVGYPPVIQSRQAHTSAVVPFGSEVAMAELDDPTSGNRVQFFVSVERFGASTVAKADQ